MYYFSWDIEVTKFFNVAALPDIFYLGISLKNQNFSQKYF